jgi:hypothetical protein
MQANLRNENADDSAPSARARHYVRTAGILLRSVRNVSRTRSIGFRIVDLWVILRARETGTESIGPGGGQKPSITVA